MARILLNIVFSIASLAALTSAQATCPNEVAIYNKQDRTMATTNTWFLVPVPKASVEAALKEAYPSLLDPLNLRGLKLLDVPPELNFPAGMHPVVAVGGMNNDIRQSDLQIATGLMTASTMIPFVSFGASQTPLTAPLISYLAGVDPVTMGYVAGLIPTPVATLGGLLTRIGAFIPLAAAWQSFSDGTLGINSKWAVLPNPASGPGVYPEAVDMKFTSEADQAAPRYSLATWRNILNMPYIQGGLSSLGSPRCVRNTNFFTNSTAQAKFRSGNVTFGSAAGVNTLTAVLQKASPDGSGFYQSVYGFSACAQVVGYGAVVPLGENCETAAMEVKNTPGAS